MIINKTEIPWNMEYIFINADIKLSERDIELLEVSYSHALNLEKHNGALIMGLVRAAAYWLRYAYEHDLPVNQKAYKRCIRDLDAVEIPNRYF